MGTLYAFIAAITEPSIEGKPQKHNMVHVEIWLGDGEKTVGARYHKGRYALLVLSCHIKRSFQVAFSVFWIMQAEN